MMTACSSNCCKKKYVGDNSARMVSKSVLLCLEFIVLARIALQGPQTSIALQSQTYTLPKYKVSSNVIWWTCRMSKGDLS